MIQQVQQGRGYTETKRPAPQDAIPLTTPHEYKPQSFLG
ncbi:hypothetical protein HCH_03000 [Hahella chejuensis KCTC 2396]|uniref:Uncharacterized protein n=1 Tax=Hahella chejuensis (strain KCTC 2396) TaxID=349521 RepID=Q2SHV6_HAHCH|nr:hypothetical protein HCH_03000 [Hahella chejuensis KCTC 2396]